MRMPQTSYAPRTPLIPTLPHGVTVLDVCCKRGVPLPGALQSAARALGPRPGDMKPGCWGASGRQHAAVDLISSGFPQTHIGCAQNSCICLRIVNCTSWSTCAMWGPH